MRRPRRLTLHHHAKYAVDARLVALAMTLEAIEHVLIQTNGQLLFRRRPRHGGLLEKGLVEPRNVRIVNIAILHTVNRGWRNANRTAAGTAALQGRFSQRLESCCCAEVAHPALRSLFESRHFESRQRRVFSPCALSVVGGSALFPATGGVDSTGFSKRPLLCRLLAPRS